VGDLPQDASTGRVDASRLLRSTSPQVRAVVLGMIEPGLGERLSDPREALRRLDAPPVVAMVPKAIAEVAPASRNPAVMVGVAVAVAALLGAVLLVTAGVPSPPQVTVVEREVAVAASPRMIEPVVPPPRPVAPPPAEAEPAPVDHAPAPVEHEPPAAEPAELTDENSAMLHIRTTPKGALVFIDLKGTCYTPCSKRVSFGRHEVRLERNDRAIDRSVQVLEETTLNVSMVE
jgi:hypothetical protein